MAHGTGPTPSVRSGFFLATAMGRSLRKRQRLYARKLGFDDDCIGILVDVEVGHGERAIAPEQRGPPWPIIFESVENAMHLIAHGAEDVPRTSDGLLWCRGDSVLVTPGALSSNGNVVIGFDLSAVPRYVWVAAYTSN